MDYNKYIGHKAYINMDGELFGKPVTILGVQEGKLLVSCDWYDTTKLATLESKYLTIQLPPNK